MRARRAAAVIAAVLTLCGAAVPQLIRSAHTAPPPPDITCYQPNTFPIPEYAYPCPVPAIPMPTIQYTYNNQEPV